MIARLRADLRRFCRWLAWARRVRRGDIAGAEALFADPDPLLVATQLHPAEVGRQERFGAAILDTAAWLEANGFGDLDYGERQVYAMWLLETRDAYERGEVRAS